MGQISLSSVFVREILLECSPIYLFTIVYGCFHVAELCSYNRLCGPQIKNIYYLALYGKSLPTPADVHTHYNILSLPIVVCLLHKTLGSLFIVLVTQKVLSSYFLK